MPPNAALSPATSSYFLLTKVNPEENRARQPSRSLTHRWLKNMNEFTMIGPLSITRRRFLQRASVTSAAIAALPSSLSAALYPAKRRPVILTTDIGDDIDDTWALGFLLKCPELDLKLVVGDYGKSKYRAKLLARFLQAVSHDQIPVGLGLDIEPHGDGPQKAWIEGYDLRSYRGKVH